MRPAIFRYAYVFALALSGGGFAQSQPAAETIVQVDVSKTANYSIPRSIFGTFLEPIGNSAYNGLWAELLRNPSFEDSLWDVKHVAEIVKDDPELNRASEMALPLPWEPLRYAQGSRYAPQWNDAANLMRPEQPLPKPPVARAIWIPEPNLKIAATAWISVGGAHHTALSRALSPQHLEDFSEIADIEYLLIDHNTTMENFKNKLRWNRVYYHFLG